MSLLSPSRCVVLLSDEGVNVYGTSGGISLLDSIPWDTEDFPDVLGGAIRKFSRGKSVLIMNDMVEQHYRKERVPNVSIMDRPNVIKRRLSIAFPSYPLRAALKLSDKTAPKEEAGGSQYLFAAVPLSENVQKALNGVQKSYGSVSGFCLLPVESATMVRTLSKKLPRTDGAISKWTVFVGQHHGGGLRQIVTKNGELALTRMTPIVESDVDQELWCSDVVNEIKGTMSYLSRFGFDDREGLDVIVIANNSVAEKIESKIDFDCNLSVLTCIEAANFLGLKIGRQEEQRFADPLHIAWTSGKTKFALPLQSAQLDKIAMPQKAALAASLLLVLAVGYMAYMAYGASNKLVENKDQLAGLKSQLAAVRLEHEEQIEKKKNVGYDYNLVDTATRSFNQLEKDVMLPLPILETIGRSLGPDISLDSLEIKPTPIVPGAMQQQQQMLEQDGEKVVEKPRSFDVTLLIKFPPSLAPEKGVQFISALQGRLQVALPDHQVDILKQVADLSYTGNFVGEATTQIKDDANKQDYEAQIRIRGGMR